MGWQWHCVQQQHCRAGTAVSHVSSVRSIAAIQKVARDTKTSRNWEFYFLRAWNSLRNRT